MTDLVPADNLADLPLTDRPLTDRPHPRDLDLHPNDCAVPFILRPATPADVAAIFSLITALADYEQLTQAVTGTEAELSTHLFGDRPYAEAVLAEVAGVAVGLALYFYNYSTFLTKPGIYLEDLFVLPDYRRHGIGKAFLTYLAQKAMAEQCGRLEWSVLDWNDPAIAFYRRMGADVLPDWRICRVAGNALTALSQSP